MLNKNEIIKELENEQFIVRNAVYEYVCRLHLYEDKDINIAFIKFIENNYNLEINYSGLIRSKLNKGIMESLIKIHKKEEKLYLKSKIEEVIVNHYSIVRDMNYNFEELITDEECLLMYKKIKHFTNKDPEQLFDLYIKNINDLIDNESEDFIKEKLIMAMGTALIQTKKGAMLLILFALSQVEDKEERDYFFEEYIPYVIYPLCEYAEESYNSIIQAVYYLYMDFIGYADECNYYFSNICNEEFINDYIKVLERKNIEDYYYDICEYLKSETIDLFLLEKLETVKDKSIKENIIRILASKFNNKVIPYAVEFLKNKTFEDEEGLKLALAPLFITNKYETDISKKVIKEAKEYLDFEEYKQDELIANMLNNFQNFMLKDKPHIKEYRKIRKLHNEIMESIMNYYMKGKFEWQIENKIKSDNVTFIDSKFDTNTEIGMQAMSNILVYKNASNMNCLTEEFIKNNQYRNSDKKELLQSMLNSSAGLFEIVETDRAKGKTHLKDVLNGKEFWITDIGLSSNINNDKIYLYTRIITYHEISFGTGLNIVFSKKDDFINNWILENKIKYNEKQEITRFMELYNEYIIDNKGMKIISKNI